MGEWPMVKLGEMTEQTNHRVGESDVPVYSVTKYDGFVPSAEYFKKRVFSTDIRKYKLCTAGDFAYATIHLDEGSIGISPVKCGISPMYTTFRLISSDISPDYLLRYLKSSRALTQYLTLGSGSAERRKSIKFADLRKMEIPVPPLGEQKRIAEILGEVSKAIELVSRQLEILDDGLKTKMWNDADESSHVPLDHYIQKITSGKSLKEGDSEDYHNAVLKISAVTTGYFNEIEVKPLPKSYDPPESHRANNGDILLSRANTTELVGASALVETAATNLFLPDKLWKLQLKDQVNAYFFWHLLQTKIVRSSISKASSGSGGSMKNISQKAFLAISVPDFSNEVQNQIGNIVREQRALRHLLHRKLSLLQELQKSLATRAFAGLL